MKTFYEKWNATEKNLQVVVVSGDQDKAGWSRSMADMPFVSIPFQSDASGCEKFVPCTGYPTPGVIRADGTVGDPDCFGKVNEGSLEAWLK